nr:ScpA/B protein [Candidatus Prometheoarchaeum syntrophicum]
MWIIVEKGIQEIKPNFNLDDKNQSFGEKYDANTENKIVKQEHQITSELLNTKNIDKKRLEISNQAKIIGKIQNQSSSFTHSPAELNALINDVELKRVIHDNPWEINVENALENFRKRIYNNSEIKFRIGGRLIYSASKIVHAKSNLVIKESNEAQEDLIVNELDGEEFDELDDDGDSDYPEDNYENSELSSNNIAGILTAISHQKNKSSNIDFLNSETLAAYKTNRDRELSSSFSTYPFYYEDRKGLRYIASPVRKIYRRINIDDLGKALIKTLNYQIRSSNRKISNKSLASSILPDNILKKAEEERALVELHIKNMLKRISTIFKENNQPVSFLSLIISPDAEGIVRTLLYLLQLVNRKQAELWQIIDDDSINENVEESTGIDIFITPIKQC